MAMARRIKKQQHEAGIEARRYMKRRLRRYALKRRYAKQALLQGPGKIRWASAMKPRPVDPVLLALRADTGAYLARIRKPLGDS